MTITKSSLAAQINDSLVNHPERWTIDRCIAEHGNLKLWIANRPYADLKLYETFPEIRIGTRWQRRKIRQAIDQIVLSRVSKLLREDPTNKG